MEISEVFLTFMFNSIGVIMMLSNKKLKNTIRILIKRII